MSEQPTIGAQHTDLEQHLIARLEEFGITRLADTTGLDRLGIPTHSCVKPGTTDVIWVYSGKGSTLYDSRVSAIMECIERTSALWDVRRVTIASASELAVERSIWPPSRFTEPKNDQLLERIAWIEAQQLGTNDKVWVPADIVFTGVRPALAVSSAFKTATSNGLGASTNRDRAIGHALAEVLERDAVSCMELRASHAGATLLGAMARMLGLSEENILDKYKDRVDLAPTLDASSLPESVTKLMRCFQHAGLTVRLKAIPNDFGVPVFGAAVIEQVTLETYLGTAGYGADFNPEVAACKALLELAQSRATDRQGAREDCGIEEKNRLSTNPSNHWLASMGNLISRFDDLEWRIPDLESSIDAYIDRFRQVGLKDIAVVDFPTWDGLSVVRVLVPGVETWHATAGESDLGPRMSKWTKNNW